MWISSLLHSFHTALLEIWINCVGRLYATTYWRPRESGKMMVLAKTIRTQINITAHDKWSQTVVNLRFYFSVFLFHHAFDKWIVIYGVENYVYTTDNRHPSLFSFVEIKNCVYFSSPIRIVWHTYFAVLVIFLHCLADDIRGLSKCVGCAKSLMLADLWW